MKRNYEDITEIKRNFGCLKLGDIVIKVSCAKNSLSATVIPSREIILLEETAMASYPTEECLCN